MPAETKVAENGHAGGDVVWVAAADTGRLATGWVDVPDAWGRGEVPAETKAVEIGR